MIFGFFAKNPQKEARVLARDVTTILEMAEQTYRADLLEQIAQRTREGITQLARTCGDDAMCRARELDRYKSLHRDARRQNSQGALTAYTLLIINTKAAELGDVGGPVCAIIEQFLERWPGKEASEGTLIV